jgi:hypothetical protein
MKIKLFILLAMLATSLQAQNDPDYDKNTNFGIKLGISASTMFGGELANPTPLMGYVAGIYYHNKLDKKLFHYQTGLDLRLRGSNFNNVNETQANRTYSRIGIISVDMPLNLLIKVGEFTKAKANQIMVGIQPGIIFRSVVYIGADQMPLNSGNFSSTWDNLPLKNFELTGLLGYQHKQEGFGYQIALKVGLNNLNNNFKLTTSETDPVTKITTVYPLLPLTGLGKHIGTASLEFAFIF